MKRVYILIGVVAVLGVAIGLGAGLYVKLGGVEVNPAIGWVIGTVMGFWLGFTSYGELEFRAKTLLWSFFGMVTGLGLGAYCLYELTRLALSSGC